MSLYRAFRRGTILRTIVGREPFYWIKTRRDVVEMGSKYGRWGIDTSSLSESTIVASFGLGEDITFEAALVEKFGCTVFGFDPTPRSIRFIEEQVTVPHFHFFPYALADSDGTLTFTSPPKASADQVSASAFATYRCTSESKYDVPCLTLESSRRVAALPRIDVLKLDIEGAEYAVIEQAVKNKWMSDVTQVLVEFHHFLPGLSAIQTRLAISCMLSAGFEIGWIGRTNHEYLFVRSCKS